MTFNIFQSASVAATLESMTPKIWSPAEFEALSPAEQDRVFEQSIVRDLDEVPAAFLDEVRARVELRNPTTPPSD